MKSKGLEMKLVFKCSTSWLEISRVDEERADAWTDDGVATEMTM